MKSLICPKCGGSLVPVIYRKIEIDRCQQCGGIWFDRLEVETLKHIKGSEIVDLGNLDNQNHQFDRVEKQVNCPRCQKSMIRMLDIDRYSIWYEKCLHCQGVWLDAGEFKQFKDNFQPQSLLDLAKKVWHWLM